MPIIDIFMGIGLIVCAIILPFVNNIIPENVEDIDPNELYSNMTLTSNYSCEFSALLYVSTNERSVDQMKTIDNLDSSICEFIEVKNISEDELYNFSMYIK